MKCRYCNFEIKSNDKYCENCGAAVDTQPAAMNDIFSVQEASSKDSSQTDSGYQGGYNSQSGSSEQSNGYSQAQGGSYGQPNNYGQSNSYGQPNNYGQPNSYGQPQGGYYGQQNGYGQSQGGYYRQQNSYGQPNGGYNGYPNGYGYNNMGAPFDPRYFNAGDGSPRFAGFGEAIVLFFKNAFNFKVRSTRSEFWFAILFIFIAKLVIGLFAGVATVSCGLSSLVSIITEIVDLIIIIPQLSLSVRRLHDMGKSGWWMSLSVIMSVLSLISTFFKDEIIEKYTDYENVDSLLGLSCFISPLILAYTIVLIVFFCQASEGANKWGLPARPKQ